MSTAERIPGFMTSPHKNDSNLSMEERLVRWRAQKQVKEKKRIPLADTTNKLNTPALLPVATANKAMKTVQIKQEKATIDRAIQVETSATPLTETLTQLRQWVEEQTKQLTRYSEPLLEDVEPVNATELALSALGEMTMFTVKLESWIETMSQSIQDQEYVKDQRSSKVEPSDWQKRAENAEHQVQLLTDQNGWQQEQLQRLLESPETEDVEQQTNLIHYQDQEVQTLNIEIQDMEIQTDATLNEQAIQTHSDVKTLVHQFVQCDTSSNDPIVPLATARLLTGMEFANRILTEQMEQNGRLYLKAQADQRQVEQQLKERIQFLQNQLQTQAKEWQNTFDEQMSILQESLSVTLQEANQQCQRAYEAQKRAEEERDALRNQLDEFK